MQAEAGGGPGRKIPGYTIAQNARQSVVAVILNWSEMARRKHWFWVFLLLLCSGGSLAQPSFSKPVLDELIAFNREMKTDRLVLSIGDTIISDLTFRGDAQERFLLYSITKVFSGIAVGLLVDQGLLESPEVPVAAFFTEWKGDTLKEKITIRHILHHTSGLFAPAGSRDIYPQADIVRFALGSPVVTTPGQVYFYNNRAINIISGIVRKRTGLSLEAYIKAHVFDPLGIIDYQWKQDAAGNSWGMDGLWMNATDLLKVGQLLCNYGQWNGRQILSRRWCAWMFQIPLVNAMNGKYGYAAAIRSLPILEEMAILPETIDTLGKLGLPASLAGKLAAAGADHRYTYPQLGAQLKAGLTGEEMEAITSLAAAHLLPLYTVVNGNFYIMHGGEYGLLLAAFPRKRKVMVRFLGEKWGRQPAPDGVSYKYLVDDQLIGYMLRL